MSENRRQYWAPDFKQWDHGSSMELRSAMAWDLIRHFGSVAGTPYTDEGSAKEDRAGRAVMLLQSPEMLVSRCYRIVDILIDTAEQRGEIKGFDLTDEEMFTRGGELKKIASRAEYPINDTPTPEYSQEELEMRARHATERAEMRAKQREKEKK